MESAAEDLDFGSIHLSEEEAVPVVIQDASSVESDRMRSNCLLGKLMIDRGHDIRSMRAAFTQSWGCQFDFVRLQPNLYQVVFNQSHDADRVFLNGPWCFSNSMFCLQRWVEDWESSLNLFSSTVFWVHVVRLPYHLYTETIGQHVRDALKSLGAWQLRTEQPSGCRLFRMRVSVDLRRPIRRFVNLLINGKSILANLQYERLPHICGQCGMWDHTVSACRSHSRELTEEERDHLPYGEKQELNATRRSTLIHEFRLDMPYERPASGPHQPTTRTLGLHSLNSVVNARTLGNGAGDIGSGSEGDVGKNGDVDNGRNNVANNSVNYSDNTVAVGNYIQTIGDVNKNSPHKNHEIFNNSVPKFSTFASGNSMPSHLVRSALFGTALGTFAIYFIAELGRIQASSSNYRSVVIGDIENTTSTDEERVAEVKENGTIVNTIYKRDVTGGQVHIGSNKLVINGEIDSLADGRDVAMELESNIGAVSSWAINEGLVDVPECPETLLGFKKQVDSSSVQLPVSIDGVMKVNWKRLARQVVGKSPMLQEHKFDALEGNTLKMIIGPLIGDKRSIDGCDGETASKKSRQTFTEPLVVSAESQAHPAP